MFLLPSRNLRLVGSCDGRHLTANALRDLETETTFGNLCLGRLGSHTGPRPSYRAAFTVGCT